MMKNLRPLNVRVVGLGGKRIRFTHRVYWLIPLVDDNVLLTFILIPDINLLPEDGKMFLSPNNMYQFYPIKRKPREGCQEIVHHNC